MNAFFILRTVLHLYRVIGAFFQSFGLHSSYTAKNAGKRRIIREIAASESEQSGKKHDFAK
jgi:hypothetical protein